MLEAARGRYLYAALYFSACAQFRSNGVLLVGYLLYYLLAQPMLVERRTVRTRRSAPPPCP
jgi:hypothetical protein